MSIDELKRMCDLAWAAGFFEGEGCVHLKKERRPNHGRKEVPVIQLNNTDKDVLERFIQIVGYGRLLGPYTKKKQPTNKPYYTWYVAKVSEVERILLMLLPFLGERRKQKTEQALYHLQ